jgi:hypothetical protein
MAKWDFTASNGQLVANLTPNLGDVTPRTYSFKEASIEMAVGKIKFFESGVYKFAALFTAIGEIDGVEPDDLADAKDLLLELIPNSGGGGASGSNYNTPTVYDKPADLPITFNAGTIHSISVLATNGTTTIIVDGEETTLIEGQEYFNEATTLIDVVISIDSTTGTFIATTLN